MISELTFGWNPLQELSPTLFGAPIAYCGGLVFGLWEAGDHSAFPDQPPPSAATKGRFGSIEDEGFWSIWRIDGPASDGNYYVYEIPAFIQANYRDGESGEVIFRDLGTASGETICICNGGTTWTSLVHD